jgi:membrane protease subunit HflK
MEQNIKKIGLVNLLTLLVVGVAAAFLSFYSHTLSGQVGLIFLGLGFLVIAVSYFQMRMEETERLEKMEFDELNKAKGSSSLFNATDAEAFPAQRSREQFERFFVPGFTVVLFILQVGAVYWLSTWLRTIAPLPLVQPAVAMSLFGLFALVLFLLGKYSSSLARQDGARLLRPGASYLLLGAYISFVVAASLAAVQMGFPNFDLYAARILGVVLALAAVETLINLILEIYRPRVKGKVKRPLYESRLVGLLAQPEGLVTTAAQALDYQFGFKVSETWFYRFLEKALAWLVLLQLGLLWLSTAVVFISPGEQALLERFGRPLVSRPVLEPGLHFKMPWPVDQVYRARTREIQTFNIGFVPDPEKEKEITVVWTVPHYKEEFNLLVASRGPLSSAGTNAPAERGAPVDMLTVSIPVQYQIKDLRAWFYNHTEAGQLLEKVATREVVRYLVGVDLFDIMSRGRAKASKDLQDRIQKQAADLKLGVEIIFVGLQDIHPPVKVAKKFEEVNGARQEVEASLRAVEGYAAKTTNMAAAEGIKRIREAEAYAYRRVAEAQARAGQFTNQLAAYRASPGVFSQRAYLQALERGATNSRKYVLAVTNTQDVILLNLEDKIRPDLLDIPAPTARR